jgi:hypothetical protein
VNGGERRLPACRSRQLAEAGNSRAASEVRLPKPLSAGLPATTGWQPVLPRISDAPLGFRDCGTKPTLFNLERARSELRLGRPNFIFDF